MYVLCFVGFSTSICAAFFFFNDTATTEIYTLSLHDALPISRADSPQGRRRVIADFFVGQNATTNRRQNIAEVSYRSEEHTSELQSLAYLVCRLLLEKKKYQLITTFTHCSGPSSNIFRAPTSP